MILVLFGLALPSSILKVCGLEGGYCHGYPSEDYLQKPRWRDRVAIPVGTIGSQNNEGGTIAVSPAPPQD